MYYLYGSKRGAVRRLTATFDTAEQLREYADWATLERHSDGTSRFHPRSVLSGFEFWQESRIPQTADDPARQAHNPTPGRTPVAV